MNVPSDPPRPVAMGLALTVGGPGRRLRLEETKTRVLVPSTPPQSTLSFANGCTLLPVAPTSTGEVPP